MRRALLLSLAGLLACAGDPAAPGEQGGDPATVVRVVDGDTFVASLAGRTVRVRLIGVDAPEARGDECYARAATAALTRLMGSDVRLVYDVERRDRYGRTLAYVYAKDVFVNRALVDGGFAQPATFPPNVAHVDEFLAASRAARAAGRGLWGACG